jgi:replicative DNA helicase
MSNTSQINYSNIDTERKALATLASLPYPAEESLSFLEAWFTLPEAPDILAQLRAATTPIALNIDTEPSKVDELPSLRRDLRDLHTLRQLEKAWIETAPIMRQGNATLETIDRLHAALKEIKAGAAATAKIATLADVGADYWRTVEKRKDGAKTGMGLLDDNLGGGFLPGTLVALLGAPGMGKTAFGFQMAETMAAMGRPICYISSEDSPFMLLCRAMARLYTMDYSDLSRGKYVAQRVNEALDSLKRRQSWHRLLTIDASAGGFKLDSAAEQARQHFMRYDSTQGGGPGVLFVDYLQRLVRSSGTTDTMEIRQAVTAFTEQLRVVANELQCTVIVLAAQGRSAYVSGTEKSALGTAKESGDIEYTCDVLMGITDYETSDGEDGKRKNSKPAPPHGELWRILRIDKNRQGKTGAHQLKWEPVYQRFSQVEVKL